MKKSKIRQPKNSLLNWSKLNWSTKVRTPPYQIPPKLEGGDVHTTAPRGHDNALPGSLAPSVMEMEATAVGKEEFEAAERRSRRAGAGDASVLTNPDGTHTYNKASRFFR